MFNTSLRSANTTKLINQDPFRGLPLYSYSKTKYQTPYKPSNTTNVTRNATMSLYSFTSKKKTQTFSKKQTLSLKRAKAFKTNTKSKMLSATRSTHLKSKQRGGKKGKKRIDKPSSECDNQRTKQALIQNNLSLYRSRNMSLDGQKKVQLMGKISKIFDLVMLNSQLPTDVEHLLTVPIRNLRKALKSSGRTDIASKLMVFKNECSSILKQTSNAQICLFLRWQLPSKSRWQLTNPSYSLKKQSERSNRERYYQCLIPKQPYQPDQSSQKLQGIQSRLDYFLQNSLKNRKVYI